jgi:hypothetical protein
VGAPTLEGEAVSSAADLSAAMGVCAPAIAAVNKQKMSTVNEATMCTGDLEPSIFLSLFTSAAGGETLKKTEDQSDTRD